MEKGGKNRKAFTLIIVIIALLAFAYFYFFNSEEIVVPSFDEFGNPVETAVVGQDLIQLLDQIQGVQFDESLFSSAAFRVLTDYAIVLTPEPVGRNNPFAEIGRSQ
ncbi:MAG: hypothetical protein A2653_00170 [Candidatus Zambryskibacteria bacterium RIFCSPHIGHO2_01_FULL_43_25]|uniref:Uncharacterized protein n=1 Tax=Candidatus Zambryskibacteria bacterium RIFCSPLOWO2_01_FULL_45_21 TaxID=1802761 RepID=A0A1G2U4P6_9BACT|nr:MAG: hypothetical protein A2653_00170 [Candidatus Zambryskibacteria bacterium RIFCSPHIGHO2_01_FULL_43_25]OHB00649.1 MAG: hypothetical protein A3E94_03425 [Candidatus Zambryskibacteria bacterium RIFCSPHIGHO2_12_FULL_44_12b]OHB04464.1 MAG: hypothetical protein A3B14_03465 [Candidatus Zambryskibacteria bacterium RIFCSPLOWO2_01_FULL_45_21]